MDKANMRLEALRLAENNLSLYKEPYLVEELFDAASKFYDYIEQDAVREKKNAEAEKERQEAARKAITPTSELGVKVYTALIKNPDRILDYIEIQHPIRGAIPLVPYDFQRRMFRAFAADRNSIITAARQMGKSHILMAYVLWYAAYQVDQTVIVLSNNYSGALELMERFRYMYERLPEEIRPKAIEYNKGMVRFDNGSRVIARAVSENSLRGLDFNLLVIDEFAYVGHALSTKFFKDALARFRRPNDKVIIVSTPPSVYGGAFCDVWDNGSLDYWDKHSFPAAMHPERTESDLAHLVSVMGQESFDIQYGCKMPIRPEPGQS